MYKFNKIFWSVSFGNALDIYREKKERDAAEKKERMRFEMMMTEILAKVWGADLNLVDKFDGGTKMGSDDVRKLHMRAGAKIIKK
ncbi:MAG: hypothetical protein K1X86_15415 [Ignavibacteria bacterium]|nr:hypothetical protein [Ignavibacteria bacterium]